MQLGHQTIKGQIEFSQQEDVLNVSSTWAAQYYVSDMGLPAASLLYFFSYDGREVCLKPNCLCLAVFFEIRWMQTMKHQLDESMFVLYL